MKKAEIEASLRRAVSQAPTVPFDQLASMPYVKMNEHDYITRQQVVQKPRYFSGFSAAVSCCVILLVCFSAWFVQYRMTDSVITLDVNPSLEIITNRQNRILSVTPLNNDAQKVTAGQNYKNTDLNHTVDALFETMMNLGYFSKDNNTVMISVENNNVKKATALARSCNDAIRETALSHNISPLILMQTFTNDAKNSGLAEQYGVSAGKMRLIQEVISVDNALSIESLCLMPIEDLLTVAGVHEVNLNKVILFDNKEPENQAENQRSVPSNSDTNTVESTPSEAGTDQNTSGPPSNTDISENSQAPLGSDMSNNDSSSSTTDTRTKAKNPNHASKTHINKNKP